MNSTLSRRHFVTMLGAGLTLGPSIGCTQPEQRLFAYVGSWTQGPFGVGGGGGISIFAVDFAANSLTRVGHTAAEFENMNAGYLCISPDGRFLYATDEINNLGGRLGAGGGVMTFSIDRSTGALSHLGTQPSMGATPAHISIDPTGERVFVANHGSYDPIVRVTKRNGVPEIENLYDDGTVSIFPVRPDGTLAPASDVAVLERLQGPDPLSQRGPHAHSINLDPSNRFVLVCDKGADRLYTFGIDPASNTFGEPNVLETESGISPRHSAFHPSLPYAFVINERQSTLSAYRFDSATGVLELLQTEPTIPAGFTARNTPADVRVHPNGRFLYGSNRGHDSIAIFGIDQASGALTALGNVSTEGSTPRGFTFDPSGRYVFVANQGSDEVVVFAVDEQSGMLAPAGMTGAALKPACVQFLSV